ncbi:MAG TPA: hypothetical protein VHB18_05225 [Mycobacteriales bacterium]|nr:hypothetical protein [Mycobacteriales bacterium]
MSDIGSDDAGRNQESATGCVLVVASYSDKADVVGQQTAVAGQLALMTPTLGDLVDVHFLDLGARPATVELQRTSAAMIAEYLRACAGQQAGPSAVTMFAVILVDSSRQAVRRGLQAWIEDPVLGAMRVQFSGAATVDDEIDPDSSSALSRGIVTLRVEGLQDGSLIRLISRVAESILTELAEGRRRGVTLAELDALEIAVPESEGVGLDLQLDLDLDLAELETAPVLVPDEAEPLPVAVVAGECATSALEARLAPATSKHGKSPQPEAETAQEALEVVYLLLYVDEASAGTSWRRARKFVDDIVGGLRGIEGCDALRLRILPGIDGTDATRAYRLEEISKKAVPRQRDNAPIADRLDSLRLAIGRDSTRYLSRPNAPKPLVIVYCDIPPLADAITVARCEELADLATLVWVVSPAEVAMMSDRLADASRVLPDGAEVASEVSDLLRHLSCGNDGGEER